MKRLIIITAVVGVVMAVFMSLVPKDSQAPPKPAPVTVVVVPQPVPVPAPEPQPTPVPQPTWTPPPTEANTPLPDVDAPNINWPNHLPNRPKFCKRHWYC